MLSPKESRDRDIPEAGEPYQHDPNQTPF